ncbi:HsdM family class I SAM-dependent methyltransferase [Microbacterium sp. Leaf161]|uniref:HsdM family class I SAM-dependent methyltransferase n=1 Tax=Microbacterium sp. Leaf161 TaxID=1736281 RepID=UPI00138F7FA6|nr:N-6 DNA methylase [Microbacterium sp. Leaf161]
MSNEELNQRGYLSQGALRGTTFGAFELLNIGNTNLAALVRAGLQLRIPSSHSFTPLAYKAPQKPASLKPDTVYLRRDDDKPMPVAVGEHKKPSEFSGPGAQRRLLSAQEQALMSALALEAPLAFTTDGSTISYVDVSASVSTGAVVALEDRRAFTPGVLEELLRGQTGQVTDPTPLAERIWQLIWHATKAEPKECLLTFVEIFMLKFLSDNLPNSVLPSNLDFYSLVGDPAEFAKNFGVTEVEYYVNQIRPKIKSLFPEETICEDPAIPALFGMKAITSKTSIIDGFVFLQGGAKTHESYNNTFRSIIDAFDDFGPLTNIDPEFKLRLYETFLRKSARLQRLGQFFTPRNVVRPMVAMAQLDKLNDGDIVLDPAAGVGGFLLEPLMWADALEGNLEIKNGKPKRRIRTIGLDIDPDLHILAKANMLIHLAEIVRDPATTMSALNKAMAESFVLMDDDKTLGSLLQPPTDSVSVVLTNPPYVTRGSAVYKDHIKQVQGARNGKVLKDYYDKAGLGVEALFLRYVSGALKPGGRAFVIVPQGLLNRTETGPKQLLLDECNILASIQLPRNAFFNTAQKTYILVLERRHTSVDDRPDVLCGIARSIGESLDWRRTPSPDDNDLADIAAAFVRRDNGDPTLAEGSAVVKVVPGSHFGPDDRWDVLRFWDDEELVELGESVAPVGRTDFIEEARDSLDALITDLDEARRELEVLTAGPTVSISIADESLFKVRSGTRITTREINEHPPSDSRDEVVVYSCFKNPYISKGSVSRTWLATQTALRRGNKTRSDKYPLEPTATITVNANGASVGKVFVRPAGCLLTDDVIAVTPAQEGLFNLDYLSIALQNSVTAGGYLYEAKLFATRVRELEVSVPVNDDGSYDRAASADRFRYQTIRWYSGTPCRGWAMERTGTIRVANPRGIARTHDEKIGAWHCGSC